MLEMKATAVDTATKAKPYVCATCTRPFARLEHLKRHERSHTKEKPFCCEQASAIAGCGRRFARRDLLLRHQQKIHLFPNVSKRRRLSTVSATSVRTRSISSLQSVTESPALASPDHFTMGMPNLADLANFSNGTINPSSIYSSSPPSSANATLSHFMHQHLPMVDTNLDTNAVFTFSTEKLFPTDVEMPLNDSLPIEMSWPMPALLIGAGSPSSTDSSDRSPTSSYGSLGPLSSLEMAGSDSDFFSPEFFLGTSSSMAYQWNECGLSPSFQIPPQLLMKSQLEMMHEAKTGSPSQDNFQFSGAEQQQSQYYMYRPTEIGHYDNHGLSSWGPDLVVMDSYV